MFDARAASGSVFSWGRNNNGRLGHGHSQPVSVPEKGRALQGAFITKVACGWSHSLCYSGTTTQAHGRSNQVPLQCPWHVHLTPVMCACIRA